MALESEKVTLYKGFFMRISASVSSSDAIRINSTQDLS